LKLFGGLHLAYCTNVHPGENWAQTFDSLNRWTLAVKDQLGCQGQYAIGLRLSDKASRELIDPEKFLEFQRWLERHVCYVFTINGFPFGRFHNGPVKEQVYLPDWTSVERLEYTNRLFDLLARLVPPGIEGSVSTLPGSFKEFITGPDQVQRIRENLWQCVEHIARVSERAGRVLHLGLEPEPLALFENTDETVKFFDELRQLHSGDKRLDKHLGVNYDTCHFAVEFEEPQDAIARFQAHGIRLSKIHLSNAIKLNASNRSLKQLASFADDVYLHQVIECQPDGALKRFKDLPLALKQFVSSPNSDTPEWRVHFHVPLHAANIPALDTTSDHVIGVLKMLKAQPDLCSHLEMETYTWAVLPEPLRTRDVSEQLVNEYRWTLRQMAQLGLASLTAANLE
jgi:hypothetical protein